MSRERRKSPRVAERLSIALTHEAAVLEAETSNLSTSGAYCTIDRFIAPMTKLQLQFEVPNHSRRVRIRCQGVVVRSEPVVMNPTKGRYAVAIYFTELTERDRTAIAQFVSHRLSLNPSPPPSTSR